MAKQFMKRRYISVKYIFLYLVKNTVEKDEQVNIPFRPFQQVCFSTG